MIPPPKSTWSKRIIFPERREILLLKSLGTRIVYYKKHQTSPWIVEKITILPSNVSSMWGEVHACFTCLSLLYGPFSIRDNIPLKFLYEPPESLKLHCRDHLKQRTKAYWNLSKKSNIHSGTIIKICSIRLWHQKIQSRRTPCSHNTGKQYTCSLSWKRTMCKALRSPFQDKVYGYFNQCFTNLLNQRTFSFNWHSTQCYLPKITFNRTQFKIY